MLKIPSFSDFDVTKHTAALPSGVKVTLFERPKTPITIMVSFLSGSRFDPLGKEGLAHFTEHMVAAGTKRFPSKDVMATFIQGLGGSYNAFTGLDTFALYVTLVEPEDFSQAIILINEMVNFPLFEEKTIETERGAILREYDAKESSPRLYLNVVSRDLYNQGTLSSRPGLGYRETIKAMTKDDLVLYYKTMITSGRAGITISGGISMDKVIEALESGLTIKNSSLFVITDALPVIRNKAVEIKSYTINDQLNIDFGFRACPKYTEDEIPLILLGNIMGGGSASALYKKLRYEKGLVYGVNAGYGGGSDAGYFTVTTEIAKSNLSEVLNICIGEFERATSGGVTNEELEFFKTRKIKSQKRIMQTSDSWVDFHAYDELIGNKERLSLPEFLKKINEVSINDITRVAKKYFGRGSWYLAICGDADEKDISVNY